MRATRAGQAGTRAGRGLQVSEDFLKDSRIAVIFRKEDQTLSAHEVVPSQVLPVYTLTIPETSV